MTGLQKIKDDFDREVTLGLNADGRIDSTTDWANVTLATDYTYDDLGRITSIVNKKSDNSVITSFEYDYNADCGYDARQIISKITREDGRYVVYDYDSMGRLIDEDYRNSNGTRLYRYVYTYDKDGNRLTKKYYDHYNTLQGTLTFKGFGAGDVFDASNRLKEVSGTIGTRINVTGTIDDVGGADAVWVTPNDDELKKVQADVTDGLWVARGVEVQDSNDNEILAAGKDNAGNTATDFSDSVVLDANVSITYSYDNKGNLIERADGSDTVYFEYYQIGLLKQVRNADGDSENYYYDALGRRYMIITYADSGSSYDTRTFVFSGASVIRELEDADTTTMEYLKAGGLGGGIGSVVYSEASDDTITFYTYNHRGDVAALIDDSEDIVALYDYDAWGNLLTDATDVSNYFTFSTREFGELSGLGHWSAREYDPFAGRWIARDPAGILNGLNLYYYVANNPVNLVDPYGLWSFWRLLYTGDANASDEIYYAALDAAANYLDRNAAGNDHRAAVQLGGSVTIVHNTFSYLRDPIQWYIDGDPGGGFSHAIDFGTWLGASFDAYYGSTGDYYIAAFTGKGGGSGRHKGGSLHFDKNGKPVGIGGHYGWGIGLPVTAGWNTPILDECK